MRRSRGSSGSSSRGSRPEDEALLHTALATPIGPLWIAADQHGLRRIAFLSDRSRVPTPLFYDRPRVPTPLWRKQAALRPAGLPSSLLRETARQLEEYFAGRLRTFDLPLAPHGTTFQQKVWNALLEISYGETISYGELARRIGLAGAARAVGLANGSNPLPIVIPCHRVIGSNGTLTGYGGGLPIKQALLSLERGERRLLLD